jgi:hypothetical protein
MNPVILLQVLVESIFILALQYSWYACVGYGNRGYFCPTNFNSSCGFYPRFKKSAEFGESKFGGFRWPIFQKLTLFTQKMVLFEQNRYCSSDLQWKNQNQAGLIFSAHGILNTASTSSVHDAPSKLGDLTLTW